MIAAAVGSAEAWALELIQGTDLEAQLAAPRPPRLFESEAPVRRLTAPGRSPSLEVVARAPKSPKPGALVRPEARARALHTFLHHEIQAAELFAWAFLAFPEAPARLRRGLLAISRDELRHARMYRVQLRRLGCDYGSHPVRDWFWERVPTVTSVSSFLALVGLGLEGGNLEHARDFSRLLEQAGDPEAAACVAQIGEEEIAHVRFGRRWFERLAGPLEFETWCAALPPPLTPLVLRGLPLHRAARERAGLDGAFLDALEAWRPSGS